jgi:hypothetical protein
MRILLPQAPPLWPRWPQHHARPANALSQATGCLHLLLPSSLFPLFSFCVCGWGGCPVTKLSPNRYLESFSMWGHPSGHQPHGVHGGLFLNSGDFSWLTAEPGFFAHLPSSVVPTHLSEHTHCRLSGGKYPCGLSHGGYSSPFLPVDQGLSEHGTMTDNGFLLRVDGGIPHGFQYHRGQGQGHSNFPSPNDSGSTNSHK